MTFIIFLVSSHGHGSESVYVLFNINGVHAACVYFESRTCIFRVHVVRAPCVESNPRTFCPPLKGMVQLASCQIDSTPAQLIEKATPFGNVRFGGRSAPQPRHFGVECMPTF